ncbi:MAG TPA: polysaccharide biosynthesis/export family protein [Hyphomicrobium sp.]|nr:polysaccharide biosynthesis/export family protein [Hyphomicrobium sp.]
MLTAVLLGGCAQSPLGELAEDISALSGISIAAAPHSASNSEAPVDIIHDDLPPVADAAQPQKAAAWGETVAQPAVAHGAGAVTQAALRPSLPADEQMVVDGGASAAAKSKPVRVAGGWQAAPQMVSPAPVGPAPVAWGPAVVVSGDISAGPTGHEPYLLDTGDRLRVFVYGQPNLSRLYAVDQIGNIAVPLIGSVRARGRTTVELERTIAARLGREFVKDPQVTVDIAQNRPFFILGEVRLPGQYPFVSGMTVEQAVAIGGGYTERASHRSYRITRKLGALVDQIEAPGDYPLCPGDTVYVYERFF